MKTTFAVLLFALFAGCESAPDTRDTTSPVNAVCPVSGEALGSKPTIVTFEGKSVGLCCGGCVDDWNAMSEADRKSMLAKKR